MEFKCKTKNRHVCGSWEYSSTKISKNRQRVADRECGAPPGRAKRRRGPVHAHPVPGPAYARPRRVAWTFVSDLDSHTVVIEHPSHSCKLCGKSFWNRDSMYKHMNMHKGTTQCPVCHKVLSRTTHMKRHLKNRHGWHGSVGTTTTATAAGLASAGGVETPAPISVSSTAQTIAQQNAGSPSSIDANATYTTIRIRESSVERITSSPIP